MSSNTSITEDEGTPTGTHWSRGVWAVVGLGAGYVLLAVLTHRPGEGSPLWWLDPALMALFVIGLWWRGRGGRRWVAPGRAAAVLFVAGSWLVGMLYEFSLRTGATGFGGMHPETGLSFLLAQGYYVPFAAGGWWLARRYGYSAESVFWAGALSSLYEVFTSGLPALLAQPGLLLLSPLIAGYYLTVYGYILAMPLLFLDERSLWAEAPRPTTRAGRIARGVALGLVCWVIFIAWAALIGS